MAGGAPILVGLDFGTTFSGIAWAFDGPDDEIEVISTWPGGGNTTWSDKAKDKTLSAAIKASIQPQDVSLISEPEAAALYALRAIQPNSVSRNDVFIVCDAGGGTVVRLRQSEIATALNSEQDLISYQIKTLEPLVLAEVTEGIDLSVFFEIGLGQINMPH
ncbi:hypothetical protein KXV80_005890 [Aspergillus fumigatus]|nr:hypothetical protein KXV80_005890 [Aspergillus fumigatus]